MALGMAADTAAARVDVTASSIAAVSAAVGQVHAAVAAVHPARTCSAVLAGVRLLLTL